MTSQSAVKDPQLERQGKRLAAPGRGFAVASLVLGIPGIALIVLAHSWMYELGWVLFVLALAIAVVALSLLGSCLAARWAARHRPFA